MTFTFRTPFAPSLFPQCWEYLAAGHKGQDERGKLETVPVSIRKAVFAYKDFKVATTCAAALESGRLAYLSDPEAGRKRYEANLREFHELVQDRASELITHYDNAERASEIAAELYEKSTQVLEK